MVVYSVYESLGAGSNLGLSVRLGAPCQVVSLRVALPDCDLSAWEMSMNMGRGGAEYIYQGLSVGSGSRWKRDNRELSWVSCLNCCFLSFGLSQCRRYSRHGLSVPDLSYVGCGAV